MKSFLTSQLWYKAMLKVRTKSWKPFWSYVLGWGSGSRNTENRKYRKIPKFNSIEYRKCSIPKFQYYWILKIFNTEISILSNTKKISIMKFNSTKKVLLPLYRKYLNVLHFQQKIQKNFVFPKISKMFSVVLVFVWYSLVFLVLVLVPNFGLKIKYWKKNQKCSTFRYFQYFGNIENINNTVQYYWILKMFNTEISILLKTEDGQYRIFNTIKYQKKFQSQISIIPKIIFNISSHPTTY